ncbi:TPA: portal protein, partial [Streptococcus pyogenes]
MGLLDLIGRKRARDKPQNSYEGQDFFYLFGRTTSGENVDEFKGIKVEFIQLSNKNIFDVLEKDLSKKLRFEDISIEAILGKYLCNNDIEIIKYLYEKDKI